MKIFDSDDLTLSIPDFKEISPSGSSVRIYTPLSSDQEIVELLVRGKGYCVWPNREGEGFRIESVRSVLKEQGCIDSGLSLSWPATASSQSIALFPDKGEGFLLESLSSRPGYHREIRIFSDSDDSLRIRFTGPHGKWSLSPRKNRWYPSTGHDLSMLPRQFQVGLIGPEGECYIKDRGGFKTLATLGETIQSLFPRGEEPPILHIFGFGEGHDRGYPDYSPSAELGGPQALREAVEALHNMDFRVSFYMNARLMETAKSPAFPELERGICRDSEGKPIEEQYFGRSFYVMNPNFSPWIEELLNQAKMLKSLGADLIQLDQIAGRAAVVPPGKPWGQGYNELIRHIHDLGMKVWIQGVSDYYEADSFEMTWRDLNILPGGIVRGGNPFGKTDLTLLKARGFDGELLSPFSKMEENGTCGFKFRIDMMGERGNPPIYGPDYLKVLQQKAKSFKLGK